MTVHLNPRSTDFRGTCKTRHAQAKPPAPPLQVHCLPWWGRRFRLPRPLAAEFCKSLFSLCLSVCLALIAVAPLLCAPLYEYRLGRIAQLPDEARNSSKIEFAFEVSGFHGNPFDPAQICVTADFAGPRGEHLAVPGFWYQPFDRIVKEGKEILQPQGQPEWRVRFLPPEPGRWTATFRVRNPAGLQDEAVRAFMARKAAGHGFVRIHSNRRNFVMEDGAPYVPIGMNIGWFTSLERGTQDYDDWFSAMQRNGANYARIFLARPRSLGLWWTDTPDGDFTHRLDRAWRMDRILEMAESHDIRILLTLLMSQQFRTDKNGYFDGNPFNRANGGYLTRPEEVFTDARAERDLRAYFRYAVARWGYSPHLAGWELWNEVSWVDNYKTLAPRVSAWHGEMATYIKSIDAFQHPVTSSSARSFDPDLFATPQLDFITIHNYWSSPRWQEKMAQLQQRVVRTYGKPVLFAEMGYDWRSGEGTARQDPGGLHLHAGLWTGLMSGGAGTGMSWWWDSYIFKFGFERFFGPVRKFADAVPWLTPGLQLARESEAKISPPALAVYGYASPARAYLWISDPVFGPDKPTPVRYEDAILGLNLRDGAYAVRWFDTGQGTIIKTMKARSEAGRLSLSIPGFANDIAVLVEPGE